MVFCAYPILLASTVFFMKGPVHFLTIVSTVGHPLAPSTQLQRVFVGARGIGAYPFFVHTGLVFVPGTVMK